MTKVVDLQSYRAKAVEQRGFGRWHKRFGESFDSSTRIVDLSDSTLFFLAQPGESSSIAYYDFIMGILDLGAAPEFHYLGNSDQMLVVDIHLFLADQVRFEMMRRLEWIRNFKARYCTAIMRSIGLPAYLLPKTLRISSKYRFSGMVDTSMRSL